jgi:hypothetical protein
MMIEMISPNGDTVQVPEGKVDRNLARGYSIPKSRPEPEEVQEEDSHEEIDSNEKDE